MTASHHSILIYSPFSGGKTALIGELVEELLPRYSAGAAARLVTAETYNTIQRQINAGSIVPWKLNTRPHPFETCHFAMDGYWPVDPLNPESPFTAPTADTWTKFPIRIFEGLATVANYLAGNSVEGGMAQRIGAGDSIGPTDSGELIRLVDGSVVVGGLSRSNYGFVQKEMTSLVHRTLKRPGLIIWTAQEDDVKEKKAGVATGRTLIGPEVFGGALTSVIGREFSDVWRIVNIPIDYTLSDGSTRRVVERRLYLKDHVDPLDPLLVAKCRNSAGLDNQENVPDYILLTDKDKPGLPRKGVAKVIIEKLGL